MKNKHSECKFTNVMGKFTKQKMNQRKNIFVTILLDSHFRLSKKVEFGTTLKNRASTKNQMSGKN